MIFGRASARGASFCARSTAVRYMSIATSPLAWQFTWMPARCTRSTHSFSVSCVSVTLPLYGGVTPGYGVLSAIVRSENEPSTVCSEVAPNLIHSSPKPVWMPAVIIASRARPLGFVADAVLEIAARAHVLHRLQVAALVMHAGEAVAGELLRDVRDAVARALLVLRRRVGGPRCRPC